MTNNLSQLGLNRQFKDKFDDMKAKMLLVSKKTIEAGKCFMEDMGIPKEETQDQGYNSRCFLTAFLIYHYPESVSIDPFDPIFFAAKAVIKSFFQLHESDDKNKKESIETLRAYILKYLEVYKIWEQEDRKRMINDLLIQYFDIDNTLTEIEQKSKEKDEKNEKNEKKGVDPAIIKQLKGQQNVVHSRLKKFHREHHIDKWTTKRNKEHFSTRDMIYRIREENLTGFEYVGNPIEISAKTAYWNFFAESLKKESEMEINEKTIELHAKTQDTICSTLNDFKEKMKSLVPHRKDLCKYYDEYIDIDYIRHLMTNQVFKNDSLQSLISFTFDRLKELDSSFGAKQVDNWLQRWTLINQFPYDVHEVLPYILRDIMNKLEKITSMAEYFRSIMDPDSKNEKN